MKAKRQGAKAPRTTTNARARVGDASNSLGVLASWRFIFSLAARHRALQFWGARESNAYVLVFIAILLASFSPAHAANVYSNWAAVVVSGDWHAHNGQPSAIFDNARRDVAQDLAGLGFSSLNMETFSSRPGAAHPATLRAIGMALWRMGRRARSGCLLYFTSHGSPDGILLGNSVVAPRTLGAMVDDVCGERPTVVVLSACFSGVFVPALARPDRIVLTAARRDRTSFGCGQTDRYPYFDKCVLSVWPYASGFPALGRAAQICVAARERREHVGPPSQPQLFIGADAARHIPRWR